MKMVVMKWKFKLPIITLAVLALFAGALTAYGTVSSDVNAQTGTETTPVGIRVTSIEPVWDFEDQGGGFVMNPEKRGTSTLVRSHDGLQVNIDTTDLPAGAYTIWWFFFNKPALCSDGNCGIYNDSLPPPGNVAAGTSVAWATGGIVGPDRQGHFSASVGLGVEGTANGVLWGPGLVDPFTTEVHVEVRYHGNAAWDDLDLLMQQITNVGGNCNADSFGAEPYTFYCYGAAATAHRP